MDGTITINGTENQNNQQLHVANVAGEDDHHHHTIDEEQIMHLTDITDLTQDDIVSIPKEIILISLVSREQALYNPKHENYRNTQRKDVKWMEIAEHVGWSETQCKAKWKAMRDQYCRELKRSKFNIKANVKWKYFKELDFLRPYALARNYRPRNPSTTSQLNGNGAIFTCPPTTTPLTNSITVSETNNTKYTTIKLENNPQSAFDACDFVNNKTDTATTLTEDQLNSVLQQQQQQHHHQQHQPDDNNWSYLTGSTTNSSNNNPTRLDNHSLTDGHLLSNHTQQQTTDEALYNALVDCVGQIQQQQQQQHQHLCEPTTSSVSSQQPTTSTQSPPDEEDDDPIHTFLNIESYFEKELILLIQHEDVLYNSYHPNYRNVKLKMEVWDEIARKLKKTVKQCRLKWKALRDQFIREHKRLKHRDNVETLPRWKHYDALSFLQKFIKHKTRDYELTKSSLLQITKTEMDTTDMDDDDDQIHMSVSSPLRSPLENIKCEIHQDPTQPITRSAAQQKHLQQLTTLTTCHQQHHHNQHSNNSDNLCVSAGSVEGYDDMDIDNYIIGDGGSVVDDSQSGKTEDHQPDSMDEHKSQHDYDVHLYNNGHETTNHNNSNNNLSEFHHQQHHNQHTVGGLENKITSQSSPERLQQQQHITMTNLNLNSNNTLTANSVPSTLINHNAMHTITSSNNDTKATITTTFNNKEDLLMAATTTAAALSSISCLQIKSNIDTPSEPSRITVEAFTNTTPLASPIQPQRQQQQLQQPQQQQQQQNILSNNMNTFSRALTEDDEVGAFFKAIAMKIRNAKMSPVAFTDLQIDILRVINCSLRNH